MCYTGVNSVQFSSWEGSGNQDVDLNHIKNMKFDSMEDARSFYLGYARAIDKVFPNCQHRICGWHIAKNACAHIHSPKNSSTFRPFIFDHIDEDKFDECWKEMVKQHASEDNDWVNMMCEKRHRWAAIYSKGHFFAGMYSTQKFESMNNYMKEYVCSREKLFDLFPQIDWALMRLRKNYFTEKFASNSTSPVILSYVKSLEKLASSIYTYRIYGDITKEINDLINYSHFAPWNEENEVELVLTEYDSPYEKTVSVVYHRDKIKLQQVVDDGDWDPSKHNLPVLSCECKLLQNKGLPCSHVLCNESGEHYKDQESLIFKRWTKSAADDVCIQLQADDDYSKSVDIARFTSLSAECNYLYHKRSQTEEGFNLIKRELNNLPNTLQGLDDEF
ncbi:hypothetical protein Dsin_001227 [Dipteronia sinensis]|uniref:Protein FAR1-RELATED SEQUENCE n=1 Tax=Dipteronia sinensis TaxID=43782 RepID=A0AAE0B3G6_9ROSI|nr:hypothetical protein Dsin_001227 [Dipteronia sinensis]